MLSRLLLLPLLAPLLALLLIAALNPRPSYGMRLLIWRLPALPLGTWIALAGTGGAALSAGFTALALKQGAAPLPPGPGPEPSPRRGNRRSSEDPRRQEQEPAAASRSQPFTPPAWSSGPPRAPQDPLPTVSVPFRVIRRGPVAAASAGPSAPGAPPQAAATGDGWDATLTDDW